MRTETKAIMANVIGVIAISAVSIYSYTKLMNMTFDMLDKFINWIFYRKK